jgi:hypothetical protein
MEYFKTKLKLGIFLNLHIVMNPMTIHLLFLQSKLMIPQKTQIITNYASVCAWQIKRTNLCNIHMIKSNWPHLFIHFCKAEIESINTYVSGGLFLYYFVMEIEVWTLIFCIYLVLSNVTANQMFFTEKTKPNLSSILELSYEIIANRYQTHIWCNLKRNKWKRWVWIKSEIVVNHVELTC